MQKYPHLLVSLLIASLLLAGCLEHSYRISVLPTGGVEINFDIRGDRIDLDDQNELFPDSIAWKLSRRMEDRDDETVHIISGYLILDDFSSFDSVMDWHQSEGDSVFLRRDLTLKKTTGLFGESWRFNGILHSRKFVELYEDIWDYIPEECIKLEDEDARNALTTQEVELLEDKFALGVLQWNRNRYASTFVRVWSILTNSFPVTFDTSSVTFSIAYAGWKDDLHRYLNELDIPEPTTINLDWWEELRPVFIGRLIDITGPQSAEIINRIGMAIEKEYQITKDIQDNMYNFKLNLPGKLTQTNGSVADDGTLGWEIDGKELQNGDGVMFASTFVPSTWRLVLTATVAIFLIVVFLRWLKRRKR